MPVIDIEKAISTVITYLDTFKLLVPATEMHLEEVEYDQDKVEWLITFSFIETSLPGDRVHKVFGVDGDTGKVTSMRMRREPHE